MRRPRQTTKSSQKIDGIEPELLAQNAERLLAVRGRLEAVAKRIYGRFCNPDDVYDLVGDVVKVGMVAYLAAVEEQERERIENEMQDDVSRDTEAIKKKTKRRIKTHSSTATPIGSGYPEAYATIEMLLKATDQNIMGKIHTDEVIQDAHGILRRMYQLGEIATRTALEQMKDIAGLMLREGIKLPEALREVKPVKGKKISRANAYRLWDLVCSELQMRHAYMQPKGAVAVPGQRKKPPMRALEVQRVQKGFPMLRKRMGKACTEGETKKPRDEEAC